MSDTIVPELQRKGASGRFVLRIDPSLHDALRREARAGGVSLNEHCARRLLLPSSDLPGAAEAAVRRAARVAAGDLVGVVGFGSWARQEMGESSDVDILIVLEDRQRIDRGTYRLWDESPISFNGHPLEPHFVHLPEPGGRLTALWAEVAVDGVVLFEKDLRISRRLVEFRRDIAAGRVLRRRSHGQSYWVGVA